MASNRQFGRGDIVVHPRRPEWGHGVVVQATNIKHQGQDAQRLVLDFANHGRVTINTAVAPLQPKETGIATMSATRTTGHASSGGWLASLERNGSAHDELTRLPDRLSDPFESLANRLNATLDTYRYSTEARSLLEWAIAQTGMEDPLAHYTRHDLELAFPSFARDRDQHLKQLVQQIKRQGRQDLLQDALRNTRIPAARQALQRAIRG